MMNCTGLLLVGMMLVGQSEELKTLQKDVLGKWERQFEQGGQSHRLVKELAEQKETLSQYAPGGELVYQHVVDYEIKLAGGLAVFEFWNLTVVVGEQPKTEDAAATPERYRYAFKIQNDQWHEVHGLFQGNPEVPNINIYDRVTADSAAPAAKAEPEVPVGKIQLQQIAFLIGTWQNVADENDRRVFEWINNQSYIMFHVGDYREVIGWDLVHERIVSWNYGTDGGQGRGLWVKEGDKWRCTTRSFLDRWGNPMQPWAMTIEMLDENTMKQTSLTTDKNGKPDYEATFKRVTP
jgi:hypothetical protein